MLVYQRVTQRCPKDVRIQATVWSWLEYAKNASQSTRFATDDGSASKVFNETSSRVTLVAKT